MQEGQYPSDETPLETAWTFWCRKGSSSSLTTSVRRGSDGLVPESLQETDVVVLDQVWRFTG